MKTFGHLALSRSACSTTTTQYSKQADSPNVLQLEMVELGLILFIVFVDFLTLYLDIIIEYSAEFNQIK